MFDHTRLSGPERDVVAKVLAELAFNELLQATRWANSVSCADTYFQSMTRFNGFLDAAEIASCGKRGGYDRNQPPPAGDLDRLSWLLRKYKFHVSQSDIERLRDRWPGEGFMEDEDA